MIRREGNIGPLEACCGTTMLHQTPIGWVVTGASQGSIVVQIITTELNEKLFELEVNTSDIDNTPGLYISECNITINFRNQLLTY